MSDEYAIRVQDVSKMYKLYGKNSDRVRDALGLTRKKLYKEHYALHHLSFDVKKGETMGIIGTNGAGKSTILKIITGVLSPTEGNVQIDGRISALLELGAGFDMEYTGIENIYLNGTMIGFSREEIDRKLQDILDFADIGDFVYQPVKTYSSGMFVRLAFAVAINIDPEILIVDEALSVGDVFFQNKCYKKFDEFKKMGRTILFVSHDLSSISRYCDRVVLLDHGNKLAEGTPNNMINLYKKVLVHQVDDQGRDVTSTPAQTTDGTGPAATDWKQHLTRNPHYTEYGDKKAEIIDYAVLDEDGTMHILITTEVTGSEEAIETLRQEVTEVDQLGTTTLGMAAGIQPSTTLDFIDAAIERIRTFNNEKGTFWQLWGLLEDGAKNTLDTSMQLDFSPERLASLSTYVAEVVAAIMQGEEVSEDDIANLQKVLTFVEELDTAGVGNNVILGIADGMTAAGWDSDAETVAANLESAINQALGIQSPSTRMKPSGENVSAGIGAGMTEYDLSADADAMAANLETAVSNALTASTLTSAGTTAVEGLASGVTSYSMSPVGQTVVSALKSAITTNLTSSTLKSAGVNAMAGLRAGILAGQSGVISAMRSAALAAVNAAKSALKIASPSGVFRDEVGVMTMRGFGEGVLQESKAQAKIISNAARYLTTAAQGGIGSASYDNRRTYNQNTTSTIQVDKLYVRDEQDIRSLAVEIATLTRRQQRGKGLRFA